MKPLSLADTRLVMLLETPGIGWSHLNSASYWTLVLGKWVFTWQPYQLRAGGQAPGMDFKRDNLKVLCKIQILGKFCDSSLNMTMHLFKINKMHCSQCDTPFTRVIALRNSYTGIFLQRWCGLIATAESTGALFPAQAWTWQRGEDSEPPHSQLNELVRAVEWLPGLVGPRSTALSPVQQAIPSWAVCPLSGGGKPC